MLNGVFTLSKMGDGIQIAPIFVPSLPELSRFLNGDRPGNQFIAPEF